MPPVQAPIPHPPTLRQGDRLDADAFLRRWERMPDLKRAQLIQGKAQLMTSPVSDRHGQPHAQLIGWMHFYQAFTPGLVGLDNTTLIVDDATVVQPDYQLNLPSHAGGRTGRTDQRYITGSPDLVAEIACATQAKDLRELPEIYLRAGVREYLVWRVEDRAIDWLQNDAGAWRPITPDANGLRQSTIYPGLCLIDDLLIHGALRALLERVQQACQATPAHAALVDRLAGNEP